MEAECTESHGQKEIESQVKSENDPSNSNQGGFTQSRAAGHDETCGRP